MERKSPLGKDEKEGKCKSVRVKEGGARIVGRQNARAEILRAEDALRMTGCGGGREREKDCAEVTEDAEKSGAREPKRDSSLRGSTRRKAARKRRSGRSARNDGFRIMHNVNEGKPMAQV